MLTHVAGIAADAAVEHHGVDPVTMLTGIGENLARLHLVSTLPEAASALSTLRSYTTSGCCLIADHLSGAMEREMLESEHTRHHPYLEYYRHRLPAMRLALDTPGLPSGVVHGDPFLDNILVDRSTGAFCGFIDFEDACRGPFLFDVACCVIGTCFGTGDDASTLQPDRLTALLGGYASVRSLQARHTHPHVL